MPLHVVVGRSLSGIRTALLLAESGERVRLVSRTGGGPEHPLIERIAADAGDAELLTEGTKGAATLFNCASPAYNMLPIETPALAAALLTAAERSGEGCINLSNIYGLGPVDGPMTEDLPMSPTTIKGRVRAQMWEEGMAHQAGRLRFAEVRPDDFIDPNQPSIFEVIAPTLLAGEPTKIPAELDAPHSWGYPGDAAQALVTLISMSPLDLLKAGLADPIMAQTWEMQYQYQRPSILDASLTAQTFDLKPTPVDDVLRETAKAYS